MSNLSERYSLTHQIQETAQARVFRGYRTADFLPVVVKAPRDEFPSDEQVLRLEHEYALLRELDSPYVARVLALEKSGNTLALVLEDAGEVSLDAVIREPALDLGWSLRLATALAEAVASIHRHEVIHKDLKPQHFLLTRARPDAVKLIDFGIATRLSQESSTISALTELEGSPAYLSPEQTGRMNRVVDQRSDLYSLGVTLYELFTGQLPFEADDFLELVHSHIARTPRAPRLLRPELPAAVSRIVERLLAKMADDRYQSAAGLAHDLRRCQEAYETDAPTAELVMGERDRARELRLPQKLYGRERELERLTERFEAVSSGSCELLLLSGYSGIGKSALVRELERKLALGGHFVSGKFDYLNRGNPYAAIARASSQLVQATLAEPEAVHARRKRELLEALGPNGRVLLDLVPDLELLIGAQPEVPAVGPSEVKLRLELAFEHFFRTFTSSGEPLLMFLDDLQWADAASLRLVERLLTGAACPHLLIVGAFRDNEVDSVHPLSLAIEQLRSAGAVVNELVLGPLAPSDVKALLCDSVGATADEVRPLTALLLEKTHGNPFFLAQFLQTLHRDGALFFDDASGRFRWDLARIDSALATDNVVDFLLGRLRSLPAATQELVRLAACIGHRFDAKTLAVISRRSMREVMAELWPALSGGFLIPLDGHYRYAGAVHGDERVASPNAAYRFLHDRVQQAAYALIDDEQKAEAHLRIGRSLLRSTADAQKRENLFEIVDHLNRGRGLLTDPVELSRLAVLNLEAGARARNAAAPVAAARYLRISRRLFGPNAYETDYEPLSRATLLLAEASFVNGEMDRAFELLDELERHARSTLERVASRNLRVFALTVTGRLRDACLHGVQTLRLLGAEIPDIDDKPALAAALGAAFAEYQAGLGGREIETLCELPPMAEPLTLRLIETYAALIAPAYQSNQDLMVLMVLKAVALPLEHGTAPQSAFFYEQYGLVHSVMTGDFEAAHRFGELGIRLAARAGVPNGAVHFIYAGFVSHWQKHISVSLEHFRVGLRESLEVGDRFHASYCSAIGLNYRFFAGENLDSIEAAIDDVSNMLERNDDVVNRGFVNCCRQAIAALAGRASALDRFDGDGFDERGFVASAQPPVRAMYGAYATQLGCIAGEHARAVAAADACEPLPGLFYVVLHRYHRALSLAALAREATGARRDELRARLRGDLEALRRWAAFAPENHQHRAALVTAEERSLEGDAGVAAAMADYDRAIHGAQAHGFIQDQALANELCARFHLLHGRTKVARPYLAEAVYAYRRWGATAKVEALRSEFSALLADQLDTRTQLSADARATAYELGAAQVGAGLDVTAAVRAMEAVATELVLDKVLERLMRTLLGSAGAQRGFLLLDHSGALVVEASASIDPDVVELGLGGRPEADPPRLSLQIVNYVARTLQPVVLADASADPRFAQDPYVLAHGPSSVLCVPMLHRSRRVGVLYLENNSATSAFSPARANFLRFLAAQAAVAVENAKLYGELNAATESLRKTNETLEAQVSARTEELRRALAELWSEMDLAKKIQTVLLPETTRVGRYEVAATMLAADSVGGDYYDVVEAGDRDWIMIGDVSGHGVTAGLIMMMIQTAVRTIVLSARQRGEELSPALVLSRANAAVRSNLRRISDGQYMTITALELSGGRIRYSGLHQDILVHRAANDTVQRVATQGIWLGLVDDISELLENDTIELQDGDTILLYTDGITEMFVGKERLGTAGLTSRFHALASRSSDPQTIVEALLEEIGGRPANDDVTLLALRYAPPKAAE